MDEGALLAARRDNATNPTAKPAMIDSHGKPGISNPGISGHGISNSSPTV
jgi:hypothetical protein